jgi:glycosyltransferase involved in cell wall biosynthesis
MHLTPLAATGGCEVNCLRIIEACGDCDHRVMVFDEQGPTTEAWRRAGAEVSHLACWRSGSGRFERALREWGGAEEPPDAVIYWSTSRLPAAMRALEGWGAPWTVHLGNPLARGFLQGLRLNLRACLSPCPRAVRFVACSRHVEESHRESAYFRRCDIEVIYNPVDPALDRPRAHRELPPGSGPVVGMVARLDPIKDHRTLVRAMASVASTRPDVTLEFAGDGALRPGLELEARRLGVSDRVRFLGFRPVPDLLARWDVYLHSTTDSEGMGTAVAEAMASGLPCLVSDLRVMREVCGDDGASYAPAGDPSGFAKALVELIGDRTSRESIGGSAQARARRMFGLKETGAAYARVAFREPGPR